MRRLSIVAVAISFCALLANQGCADGSEPSEENPASEGDDDSSDATTTTKPPGTGTATGTGTGTSPTTKGDGGTGTKPGGETDAGTPEGDAGTKPPETCADFDDVGGTEATAKKLGNIDDCDGSGGSALGVVNGSSDVDMYSFDVNDSFLCRIGATSEITAPGLELCMFLKCGKGDTEVKGCGDGKAATSGGGLAGCCRTTPGSLAVDYNCNNTTKEDVRAVLRVKSTANACTSYTLRYHF